MFDRSTRLFLRYRDRGDTAALAAVFDRTGPELLRLSLHLCRNLGDAEDLLQATYLAAIESAPRFDRSKKVMPWLAGILVNRARAGRRQELRASAAVGEPDALVGPPLDPSELAADRELSKSARDALDQLDEPFRQPMLMRFVHGMEPAEIALLLHRSPGTVRGQLHRGLERLRGTMPTAVATAIAATALTAGRGLAAVRKAVLDEAVRSAAATTIASAGTTGAALTLTVAMTKKVLLTSLVVACTIAVGVFAWLDPARPDAPEAGRSNVVTGGVAAIARGDSSGDAQQPAASRVKPAERKAALLPGRAPTWPVAVVVVDGTTGEPIVDAAVSLHGPRTMTLPELQRAFADVAPAGWTGVPMGGRELRALHDLPIEVLAGGEACDLLIPPAEGAVPLVVGTTDRVGRCVVEAPAEGAFLVVQHRGYGLAHRLIDEDPTKDLEISLWPARTFAGIVRTTAGEVPPQPLRLALHGAHQVWFVETDELGRFRAEVMADAIEVQCATPGWTTSRTYRKPGTKQNWIGTRRFRVGGDADVYVAAYGATRLHVTDAAAGQPIETFGLVASDQAGYPCRCGQFVAPGGLLALEAPTETQSVLDQPEMASYRTMRVATMVVFAEGYEPFVLRDVPLVGADPKTIEVALQPGSVGSFAGKVTRGGDAVPTARVQLRPLPKMQWDSGRTMVIATQNCGEHGGFALTAPPGPYVCEVFVDGECELQQQVVLPTPGPVELDLGACVFVDVVVVDPRGAPVPDHNVMVGAGVGQRGIGRTGSDGHVVFGPFPAGKLHARAPREATEGSWISAVEVEIEAGAGAKPTITLQLPPTDRVRPVLVFDGPGPDEGFAGFTAAKSAGANTKSIPVEATGRVAIALVPGMERLLVAGPGGRRWSFKLPKGARDGHALQLRWQGLGYVGRAVDEADAPIANCRLHASPLQPGPTVSVQTAADGSFRLDGLEPCRYRLSIADRPLRSQDKIFPRQHWLPLAAPAVEPEQLQLQFHRADDDLLRGFEEFALLGRLVDAAGDPVANATAGLSTLIQQGGGVLEVWPRPVWQYTDSDGRFRLQVVRGSRYRTQFRRKPGVAQVRREVVLPADRGEVQQQFVLR